MLIGIPKETKDHEFRVGVTPAGVHALVVAGHEVHVQTNAGAAIGLMDADYRSAGARVVADAKTLYQCPLIVKVKEPQPDELDYLYEGQVLFCYLHLAASLELTSTLLQKKIIAVAFETVTDATGGLPLLVPMSEVAGRIAIQVGANSLHMANGGAGVLLGGVPGVAPGKVVVIGAGTVGTQAARMALGLGADVTIMDINLQRLRYLDDVFGPRLKTRFSETDAISALTREADLVVSSIYLPGKRAPKLITREMVRNMKRGAVLVDVAIDQGGSTDTSRPTTHTNPTYIEEGVVHYCVTNMPSAVATSATDALTHATLPFLLKLAQGLHNSLREHPSLRSGLQLYRGQVTHSGLAEDLSLPYASAESLLD